MKVLVPGGGGFIGGEVVRQLREAGHQASPGEPEDLPGLLRQPFDAVVFCQGGRSDDEAVCRAVHVETTRRVLEAVRPSRCVYLSSGEVYGSGEAPFTEGSPLLGDSPYATAKRVGERAVLAYAKGAGAAGFVLRLGVVYGPGQRGSMLIPGLLRAFTKGRRLPMSAGAQTRDFLHVQDVTRLILRCLEPDAPPGIYNGGTGRETSVAEVVLLLAEEASRLVGADLSPLLGLGDVDYRQGEQMRYVLSPRRAEQQLGWRAVVGLPEGVTHVVHAALGDAGGP